MSGSCLRRSWEVSSEPDGALSGGAGKGNRNPAIHAVEKLDAPVVPKKLPNKGKPAEEVEGRGAAKGNAVDPPAGRTQSREAASKGLEGIRETAKRDRRVKFTALLHHITPSLLVESFYDLNKTAAVGVDGVTWQDYENILYVRVHELHREIHTGAYRAQASRRSYILKADGKLRPLGIAAVEDKIVQQAVVKVLSAIYEEDFLGFSYGFRQERGQHDALDAVWMGISTKQIGWILDADISAYFDTIDHEWMHTFLQHRIADKRILRLIKNWLKAGVIEDGKRIEACRGTPQGAVISPLLANIYLHYVFDTWANHWRKHDARGDAIMVRYADDSVIGFQHEEEAERFLEAMRERFAKFGLKLHPQKTRLVEFGRNAEKTAQRKRAGEAGNIRLPRLHALLLEDPARGLQDIATDDQETAASDACGDPRQADKEATRTNKSSWGMVKPSHTRLLQLSCRTGQSEKAKRFPARSVPCVAQAIAPTQPTRQDDMGAI